MMFCTFGDKSKYRFPLPTSGQYRLWICYDQTKTQENFMQKNNKVKLWKGKVKSNAVVINI
jgi:hypothetical protein